jgi:hypothetical protein
MHLPVGGGPGISGWSSTSDNINGIIFCFILIPLFFACSKERGKEKSRQKQMLRCFCQANAQLPV